MARVVSTAGPAVRFPLFRPFVKGPLVKLARWLSTTAATFLAPGSGQIVGVHSGKCVDVKGAKTADGTPIQLYACNGTSAQSWKLEAGGTVRALGKCLDVQYAKTENGSLLGLNSCHQGTNQKWEQLPGGLLRGVHSGKCLDALGWATGNGTRLGIWDCAQGHTNQQWRGSALGT